MGKKLKQKNEIPDYIPFYYKLFLKLRKVYRQASMRQLEKSARKGKDMGLVPDGEIYTQETFQNTSQVENPKAAINKCAAWMDEDFNLPHIKPLVDKLNALKTELSNDGFYYANAAGTFLKHLYTEKTEKTKMWENVWSLHHSGIKPGDKVLDLGGASTIFSFYLASIGCDITVIDNDWGNCGTLWNTNYVAKKKGWKMKGIDLSLSERIPFDDETFDHVTCICVIEHLPSFMRKFMMSEIKRVLKPGRQATFTTDFDHKRPVLVTDKGLRFAYRDKFNNDVIEPSGMKLVGNSELIDVDTEEKFLGAFFLQKA